jgi:3-hydroxybutyryl-CoA dehydratase
MMKEYRLTDIHPGLNHSFEIKLTDEMMDAFKNITGDLNPLHTQPDFAASYGFRDRVAYGMLVNSFYSTLVGMYLPGKYALFQSIDIAFAAPVFIGDTLTVFGEVSAVHIVYKQIEIKGFIINQDGVKVSRAKIKTGIHE